MEKATKDDLLKLHDGATIPLQPPQTPFDLEIPEPISIESKAVAALQRFRDDDHVLALPVVDAAMHPVGLVTRRKILAEFGHQFSYELNKRKSVDILLDRQPLIFDLYSDVELISRAMTERSNQHAFDPAIITTDGRYSGLLSVITLLKRMTDLRIELAFDSNPLSRLPGNISINREIDARLNRLEAFKLVYTDLDNFKAFNDYYGYERGDRVIQMVAALLSEIALPGEFVGHIGGDDFVILMTPDDWRSRAETLLQYFSHRSVEFYDAEAREHGYIRAENRQGEMMHFALMSISMAVVPCKAGLYASHVAVAEVASEIKHLAKNIPGNSIAVNRRDQILETVADLS